MSPPIPTEIISDILLRLPVKPLLRFRTVSKPWCALIDSSYFTKRHLQQSITTKSNRSLYLYADGKLYYLDYSALQSAIRLRIPFEEVRGVNIVESCTGSCNGLFLLLKKDYDSGRNDISLFNPATRQYRVIPDTQIEFPSDQVSSSLADFGFGYDSVNDDYKVMKFVQFTGRDYRWISSEARIYSLKNKSWHKIEKFPFCLPLINRNFGVHLNGRLHSVVYTSDEANSPEIMVAFDLSTEEFYYIPFPTGFNESHYSITADVFEGMLCVQGTYFGYRTDIWLMREYGVNESWFMLLSSPPLVKPTAAIFPIIMSSNGQRVLLNHDYENLVWYDLERKCIRMSPFQGLPDPFGFGVMVCVDSLVPVNSIGESQGEETEERQGRETEGNEAKEEGHGADSSIAGTYP